MRWNETGYRGGVLYRRRRTDETYVTKTAIGEYDRTEREKMKGPRLDLS